MTPKLGLASEINYDGLQIVGSHPRATEFSGRAQQSVETITTTKDPPDDTGDQSGLGMTTLADIVRSVTTM